MPPPSPRRGFVAGIGAGVLAIGCCVGPGVAALLGITSAAVAVNLATDLYENWGWAFKLAGSTLVAVAVWLGVRASLRCSSSKPQLLRFVAILLVTAVATYGGLYAGTSWLGSRASEATAQTRK